MERSSGLNLIVCPFTFGIEKLTAGIIIYYFDTKVPGGHSDINVTCGARRLTFGDKLQILNGITYGVGMESHYICTFRYLSVMCIRKFTKKPRH